MSDAQYDAALDVLRRLDPKDVAANLNALCRASSGLAEDLLSSVDAPLLVKRDPESGNQFLCCDYNRDGESYRSPWTGKYVPPVADAPAVSAELRKLEVAANSAFDTYRELYYESGLSSVYFWDQSPGFAGVVLFKKELERSFWDSIHVFEADGPLGPGQTTYRITSTVIVDIGAGKGAGKGPGAGGLSLGGNLTRQFEKTLSTEDALGHIANLGTLIEDIESKLRNSLNEIYFGKTRDIVGDIRSVESQAAIQSERKLQGEVVSGLEK